MNIRIVTHINYEGDLAGIQEIVADFCEALVSRGFANDLTGQGSPVNSIVIVKENRELADGTVTLDEFWAEEIADQVLSALPAESADAPDAVEAFENEGGSVDGA
jgi:hypothetical protein